MNVIKKQTIALGVTVIMGLIVGIYATANGFFVFRGPEFIVQDNVVIQGQLGIGEGTVLTGAGGDLIVAQTANHDTLQSLVLCDRGATDGCGQNMLIQIDEAGVKLKNKVQTIQAEAIRSPVISLQGGGNVTQLTSPLRVSSYYQNTNTCGVEGMPACSQGELVSTAIRAGTISPLTGNTLRIEPKSLAINRLYMDIQKQNICVLRPAGSACPTGYRNGSNPLDYSDGGNANFWSSYINETNGLQKPTLCCKIDASVDPENKTISVAFDIKEEETPVFYQSPDTGPHLKFTRAKYKIFLKNLRTEEEQDIGIFGYNSPTSAQIYVAKNTPYALKVQLYENFDIIQFHNDSGDSKGGRVFSGQVSPYSINLVPSTGSLVMTGVRNRGNNNACLGADWLYHYDHGSNTQLRDQTSVNTFGITGDGGPVPGRDVMSYGCYSFVKNSGGSNGVSNVNATRHSNFIQNYYSRFLQTPSPVVAPGMTGISNDIKKAFLALRNALDTTTVQSKFDTCNNRSGCGVLTGVEVWHSADSTSFSNSPNPSPDMMKVIEDGKVYQISSGWSFASPNTGGGAVISYGGGTPGYHEHLFEIR